MVAVLELDGLTKNYGAQRGVGPIDLELGEGVHGLLGPNGSGKTTMLRTLLGFLAPTAGTGKVLGFDIAAPHEVRRRVGYMAENDVLVPGLNAVQQVRLAAELCGMSRQVAHEAAAEAMHAVGLGDERFHRPQRLSTGQRQLVKLASALVHAPKLLFLDEPTNGLDPKGRRALLDLIREIADEKGISVILSTHILPDVEAVCRDAVVLAQGRLKAVEPVHGREARRSGRKTWYEVQVLGDPRELAAACAAAGLETGKMDAAVLVAASTPKKVLDAATSAGLVVSRCRPASTGVEDAVLAHMEAA